MELIERKKAANDGVLGILGSEAVLDLMMIPR
jgi:hypothetical protein